MFFGAAFTRMSSDLERMTAEELTSEIRRLKREIDQLRNDAASNKTSAERLQEAMDSSTDMVVLYDKDERIVFTNDRYHEIYPKSPPKGEIVNYSQEQLLRRSLEAGLIDHPLARKDPDAWVQLRLQQRRHAVGTVTETPHTNGRIYQIRHRRTKDGGYLIVQSDITDQKRVEGLHRGRSQALELLARDAPLADVVASLVKTTETARPGFFGAVYTLDPASGVASLLSGPTLPEALAQMPLFPTDIDVRLLDYGLMEQIFVDDQELQSATWAHWQDAFNASEITGASLFPIRLSQGNMVGLFTLFYRGGLDFITRYDDLVEQTLRLISITYEQKAAAEEVVAARANLEARVKERTAQLRKSEETARKMAAEADAASKSKSEFLAAMSHEIRTPMTGVMGFADMLLEDDLPEESREKVYKIQDSTQSLLTIINDILDVSKMEAGKLEIECIDFNLPSLLDDLIELFSSKVSTANDLAVPIHVSIADDVPESIKADPTRLRQILVNLIGNAVKFTRKGQIDIEITLDHTQSLPTVNVSVRDTGIGIAPDTLNMLFKDFTQGDASISRHFQGTGLGLAICKRLLALMQGDIFVESQIDAGSRFWFTLPFQPADAEVEKTKAISRIATKFSVSRPLHVLVAEDTDLNQRIIEATLASFGHTCAFADNGAEAIDTLENTDFDMILMDIRMPKMSGPDATRAIRMMDSSKATIPIVALTADAMAEHVVEYLDAGMNGCVTKPIDRTELAHAINTAMGEEINTPILDDE